MAERRSALNKEFRVGDVAVYPAHGVGKIDSIEEREIAGNKHRFYIMKILDTGMTIMVPTNNAGAVGLRSVISDDEADRVLSLLREKSSARDSQTWNRRYREYMDKIKTGSVFEIAKVLRELCQLRSGKTLSFGERKMLEKVRGLLVQEIAIAKDTTELAIDSEINEIFQPAAA